MNSTVVDLDSADGRAVERISLGGRKVQRHAGVKARTVRLGWRRGGRANNTPLLAVQGRWTRHFGGHGWPTGSAIYMGHISERFANIILNDPRAVADLDFQLDPQRSLYRRPAFNDLRGGAANTWLRNAAFFLTQLRHSMIIATAAACCRRFFFWRWLYQPGGRLLLPERSGGRQSGPKPHRIGTHIVKSSTERPVGIETSFKIMRGDF